MRVSTRSIGAAILALMVAALFVGVVPALSLAASLAAPAAPAQITGGAPDDDDRDLGVVGLEIADRPYCSGTLVAPRVVVTAAHCVIGQVPSRVFVGTQPGVDGETVAVVGIRVEPSFDVPTLRGDVATLVLERAIDAPSWPILPAEDAAALAGGALRLVGFGRTSADDTAPARKRVGAASVGSVLATSFEFAPSPSQTCAGDSGGPAFLTVGGVEYLAGVTSSGDARCMVHATDVRPDAYRDSLIAPALRAAEDGADEPGGCAAAPGRGGRTGSPIMVLLLGLAAKLAGAARRHRHFDSHMRMVILLVRREDVFMPASPVNDDLQGDLKCSSMHVLWRSWRCTRSAARRRRVLRLPIRRRPSSPPPSRAAGPCRGSSPGRSTRVPMASR